jgi:MFS family permease
MTTLKTSAPRFGPDAGVIILCGCAVALLAFGPRSAMGFFLTPMSQDNHWSRDVFSAALAVQNLLWGAAQPFAGAFADRYGSLRVIAGGAVLYALGLALMAVSHTPGMLDLSAGVLIGFGLAGCSFTVVLAAFGKLLPERLRTVAFGAGTAAGSFGQALFSPLAVALRDAFGWQGALVVFAVMCLAILPLSLALATPRNTTAAAQTQTMTEALAEALRCRSYLYLVLGYFTCGFQLAFITVHLPPYLADHHLSPDIGGMTLGVIGLFNVVGSLSAGFLSARLPKRYILSVIYLIRALAVLVFIAVPVTPTSAIVFGAVMGLMWLSTVPPTNGLVAVMFGTRWLSMLAGFAFLSHQAGGFLGVLIGGWAYERTGSYALVWQLSILFGVLSALVNLPIVEKPVARPAPA